MSDILTLQRDLATIKSKLAEAHARIRDLEQAITNARDLNIDGRHGDVGRVLRLALAPKTFTKPKTGSSGEGVA